MKNVIAFSALILLLSGCNQPEPDAPRDHYFNNPNNEELKFDQLITRPYQDVLKQQIKRCNGLPNHLARIDVVCIKVRAVLEYQRTQEARSQAFNNQINQSIREAQKTISEQYIGAEPGYHE